MTRSATCFISIASTLTRRFLFAIFLITSVLPVATAQFVQSNRLEIPVTREDGAFEVVPAEENGLFLYRSFNSAEGPQLQLVKLDTAFQTQWHGFLPYPSRMELMGKRFNENSLYLLFRQREIVKKDLELVVVDGRTGGFVRYQVRNFIPFVPSDFQITSRGAIIGGYFNAVPVVVFYSFETNRSKILPGLLNESGELTQIKTDSTGAFDILISAGNLQGQKTIWIKSYDPEGNILMQTPLVPDGNKHLIFARSLKTDNQMQLVAGTYSNQRHSEYSRGIFIASIDPNGLQQVKYYNYGDLGNFFKYMKTRREQRITERIQERKMRGKKIRFNYRFIVHEIVPFENQFVLLGEAFYPKYLSNDPALHGGFFNPLIYNSGIIRNGRVFDGFRYTHAVVMGFDSNGKLLWDNSFEINDVKTYTLEQFVKLETFKDRIALMYVHDNKLRSKIIQGNKVIEGKAFHPIQTTSSGDVTRAERSSGGRLNYWYGKYFYASGVQEISNAKTGVRRVFFLNRINYADNQAENAIVN